MVKKTDQPSRMEIIRKGLFEKHPAGSENTEFATAIYGLFKEYCDCYYTAEWLRIDENERFYQGKHWEDAKPDSFGDPRQMNMPKPSTPIITSTIENLKADLSDEFPEAVIKQDGIRNEVLAKVLTEVIADEMETCGFENEYDLLVHDVLNCGWGVWEVGYDPCMNRGHGGTFIRHVVNKNWLCDPQAAKMQEGRAVFKVERKPQDWFLQHYPNHYPYMVGDTDLLPSTHDIFGATVQDNKEHDYRLIEAWFRVYNRDTKKYSVHFVRLAGGQVLENSAETRPNGYFAHGEYPFVISRLFPQKGSPLGLGVTDLFKDAQRFSDKLDQILLVNAFRASRPRVFTQKGIVDYDDVRDFSKEVIEVEGAPQAAISWQQPQPLPSYVMQYMQLIRESIKQEAGSNDQSRGQTGGGVTAATAITALQEMSTKRSRMHARALHRATREASRLMLENLREFAVMEREIPVTVNGKVVVVPFSRKYMTDSKGDLPIEHYITIKTARQTKYTRMMHNELLLQMMNTLGGTVDPVIMLEGLEYDGLEPLLDKIRMAQRGGMLALQKQNAELMQMVQQQGARLSEYEKALANAEQYINQTVAASDDMEVVPEMLASAIG